MQVIKRNLPPVDPPHVVYERMNRIYREANLVTGATGPTPAQPSRQTTPPRPRPKIATAEEVYALMNQRYNEAARNGGAPCA
jgi:hypothetical protein